MLRVMHLRDIIHSRVFYQLTKSHLILIVEMLSSNVDRQNECLFFNGSQLLCVGSRPWSHQLQFNDELVVQRLCDYQIAME